MSRLLITCRLGAPRALPVALVLSMAVSTGSAAQPPASRCVPAAAVTLVSELPEASGIAMSRRTPGRFWSHNDSGKPEIIALDSKGVVAGRLRILGAAVEDWEAIAVGPCPAGSCIFVADIGDNDAKRDHITVYRIDEPGHAAADAKVGAVLRATYPDGAHDAEALLVAPDGRLYVVTKGDTGPVAMYRFPANPDTRAASLLERVGEPLHRGRPADDDRITDGAISRDGTWVVLRSTKVLWFYRATDVLSGNWREVQRVQLDWLGEPQGEGVTFGDGNAIYVMGEGGNESLPGTFAQLHCALDVMR